jgi:vacuolar-type H+-ATPase subunit E/Vma4
MSGMTNIIEIINSKTDEKEKEILSEAEAHKNQKLKDARAKAKELTASITGKAEIESNAEVSRYEASAKLQSKYKLLEAKEALIEDVLSSARKHLEDLVKKKAYGKTLEKLIVDGTDSLDETDLEIVVPKGHASNIDLKAVEAAVTKASGTKKNLSAPQQSYSVLKKRKSRESLVVIKRKRAVCPFIELSGLYSDSYVGSQSLPL